MAEWVNRTLIQAPANGTNSHTINFAAATAGNLLVAIIGGGVTHTLPTGWTLGCTAVDLNELDVIYKTAASGESSFSTTHNASNFPIGVVVYEFPAGWEWVDGVAAAGVAHSSPNPTLSGLSGSPTVFAVAVACSPESAGWAASWPGGTTEDVDYASGTGSSDYGLAVGYADAYASASYAPQPTLGSSFLNTSERATFAVASAGDALERSIMNRVSGSLVTS